MHDGTFKSKPKSKTIEAIDFADQHDFAHMVTNGGLGYTKASIAVIIAMKEQYERDGTKAWLSDIAD